ncbi:MAG: hypothetical protein A2170_16695 [Deltaproteobacteria bacterium RBG_13_53_10]|nr:MAG: hypothetical protein A2170_16695 [Deltaproteobacteria bacterium RBG_13_53_10]
MNPETTSWDRPPGRLRYVAWVPVALFFLFVPLFLPVYLQGILTKALIFAVFATSLNLLAGYTGLFSLGHAAFFGLAAYTSSILVVHYGLKSFWLVAPAGVFMAVLFACMFGFIALRVSGTNFFLVTLALGELLYSVAIKWKSMTGGTNGLVNTSAPNLGLSWLPVDPPFFYYLVLGVSAMSLLCLYFVTRSPLGVALQGIRESEPRMRALGYNTWLFKYLAFIIASAFAGVAGVLFAYHSRVLVPMHLGVTTSTLVMLMVIIGSDRVFLGPAVGAMVIILLEHPSSLYTPERWPLILGSIFVIAVMFLRGGISSFLEKTWEKAFYASAKR